MPVFFALATVVLRYTLSFAGYASAAGAVGWVRERLKDHTRALPDALAAAHDRAWQAVGLALAGDSLFTRVTDLFRAGDVTAVRTAVRTFLADTRTGFEVVPARTRVLAAEELARLRRQGRLAGGFGDAPADLFVQLAHPAAGLDAAVAAVAAVADGLEDDAPNLARVLRAAAPGGPPLLVTAFVYFFRQAVAGQPELADGLTFDLLQTLARDQAQGFQRLDDAADGLFDQFDALTRWRAATDQKLDHIIARFELLEQVAEFARRYPVCRDLSVPVRVSVAGSRDATAPGALRAVLGRVPADVLEAADLTEVGDMQVTLGDFAGAQRTHERAAAVAHRDGDREAEAEARYKTYRDACERGEWAAALVALRRALDLAPDRFAPFPLDKYHLLGILGVGGFGTVFHCKERLGRREVAVKSLYAADTVRDAETAFREAEVLAELDHPGVVRVWDKGYADEAKKLRPYLVMEYFPGGTLADRFGPDRDDRPDRLPVGVVLSIARQLAAAMEAAHALKVEGQPLLHRDIKPANVLVSELVGGRRGELEMKLIDFGLAAPATRPADGTPANRTRWEASVVGTMRYASPEQKRERNDPVGPASDIYAFGKTILEALFGTTCPAADDWATLPRRVRRRLQALLEKATRENPAARFQSFTEVRAALAEIREPRPWRPVAAAVVVVAMVAVVLGLLVARPAAPVRATVAEAVVEPAPEAKPEVAPPPRRVDGFAARKPKHPAPDEILPRGPKAGATKEVVLGASGVKLKLVWVPPGVFNMADPGEPARPVQITRGFWLGQYEVTREQWQTFRPGADGEPKRPATHVSHDDATAFCQFATSATGFGVRLPTEAEWEYASRAGTESRFHYGDDEGHLPSHAVFHANGPELVGSRSRNGWMLYDMYGNVAEWCSDWFAPLSAGGACDPTGPAGGRARVLRGGSWTDGPNECRSGYRDRLAPHVPNGAVGFRVVVVP